MGDLKKWKGLWEFSKNESWILLLSDSWLAWDWHATSFLFATHVPHVCFYLCPGVTPHLWLTLQVFLSDWHLQAWPAALRPPELGWQAQTLFHVISDPAGQVPSPPSPGHRDTDGPEFSQLGSHLLPNAPWALQWGLQWGKDWWTSLHGHSTSISRPRFL